jgi:hypothetical protein
VTGNVDSRDKDSVLIQDYPGGRCTVATHFRSVLPSDAHSGSLEGEFIREFPDLPRVEGIAIVDGERFFYVTDEDEGGSSPSHPPSGGLVAPDRGPALLLRRTSLA